MNWSLINKIPNFQFLKTKTQNLYLPSLLEPNSCGVLRLPLHCRLCVQLWKDLLVRQLKLQYIHVWYLKGGNMAAHFEENLWLLVPRESMMQSPSLALNVHASAQWCVPVLLMVGNTAVCFNPYQHGSPRVNPPIIHTVYIFPGCAGNSFNPNMLHNPHISKWQLVGKNPCMGCWKIRTYVMLLQIPSRSTCFFTPSECWISLEKATLHSLYSLHVLKISFKKTSSSS